jgi:hypothetical protein
MNTTRKTLAMAVTVAGLLSAGAVLADSAPIRLTEAQMDQFVAGAQVSSTPTYEYFHSNSNNPASADSNGTSTYVTTTTISCGGASTSCANPAQTTVVSDPTFVDGPGKK